MLKRNTRAHLFIFTFVMMLMCGVVDTLLHVHWSWGSLDALDRSFYGETFDQSEGLLQFDETRLRSKKLINYSDIDESLLELLLLSEDKRFFEHSGVDWLARAHAIWTNLRYGKIIRGASTISEQVVRMIYPRKRSLRARWFETIESILMERKNPKAKILEFYVNQALFGRRIRGFVDASRYYFGRDLSSINVNEFAELIVMLRAPSKFDIAKNRNTVKLRVQRLVAKSKKISTKIEHIGTDHLPLYTQEYVRRYKEGITRSDIQIFLKHARKQHPNHSLSRLTMNGLMQSQLLKSLEQSLSSLQLNEVANASGMIVEIPTNKVLAMASASFGKRGQKSQMIDSIDSPRQPGSTLKPFLFTQAFMNRMIPATLIEDKPLHLSVGYGVHSIKNYSQKFRGWLSLREALANSLNTPAMRLAKHVGAVKLVSMLRRLNIYGDELYKPEISEGIVLGYGEVSLINLMRAYTVLANDGLKKPLIFDESLWNEKQQSRENDGDRVFSSEAVFLTNHILTDPNASLKEFNQHYSHEYGFAVKTGTSTYYRDAWVFAFNDKLLIGIWMGNLDRTPMHEVTGSRGPEKTLNSLLESKLFSKYRNLKFNKNVVSANLTRKNVCGASKGYLEKISSPCSHIKVLQPREKPLWVLNQLNQMPQADSMTLQSPLDKTSYAWDPRIPQGSQRIKLQTKAEVLGATEYLWLVDGQEYSKTKKPLDWWSVSRGKHRIEVRALNSQGRLIATAASEIRVW